MNRQLASELKFLVNSPEWADLSLYIEDRKATLADQLIYAKSFDDVLVTRGRIEELGKLLTLRDEVLQVEKDTENNGD